ncbi:arginine--tRNA ligase [Candidatus Shikimatogenerans silvanidophilus]|uniref:arginine--tRNA ligase n=1 Tax=Candidatus Shikimatogenerans silvanidophilus TaxID=2782547 RepID=UPI001BA91234|nr:arginine--tRNA ligase [Candidatus Shikimatogenerans silvanidophilus]
MKKFYFINKIEFVIHKYIKKKYLLNNLKLEIFYNINKKINSDITIVLFPLLKIINKKLDIIGKEIGKYLIFKKLIKNFKLINGFLNIYLEDFYYINLFNNSILEEKFCFKKKIFKKNKKKFIIIEYSSPNTNKPLHIGHLRNIILGNYIYRLYKFIGKKVIRTQLINDRGIHICKSMIAWKKFSNYKTPKKTGIKGDHFVGNYYVLFEKLLSKNKKIMSLTNNMLLKWEKGNKEILNIWKKMNYWVYSGFSKTYKKLGVNFDKTEYESKTYLLGKKIVKFGLLNNIFFKKKDGSIWVDLEKYGLGKKLLLRSNGTSVYITQDIGTAIKRFKNSNIQKFIYIVGKEQERHFKILFTILKKLKYKWVKKLFHLSYGMINSPYGKMKSRYGNVIYADDLIKEMIILSKKSIKKNFSKKYKEKLSKIIGIGALKFFILKNNTKNTIIFNPLKSIDLKGKTSSYIQYTYVRIISINRKNKFLNYSRKKKFFYIKINKYEKKLIKLLELRHNIINNSIKNFNPSILANYIYDLCKEYNDYYQNIKILFEKDEKITFFRIRLSCFIGKLIKNFMEILGIEMPIKM